MSLILSSWLNLFFSTICKEYHEQKHKLGYKGNNLDSYRAVSSGGVSSKRALEKVEQQHKMLQHFIHTKRNGDSIQLPHISNQVRLDHNSYETPILLSIFALNSTETSKGFLTIICRIFIRNRLYHTHKIQTGGTVAADYFIFL